MTVAPVGDDPARAPFRHTAPRSGGPRILRPRLVATLAGRFDHRLTVVLGGPGFGKTTLLAQAVEQNRLDERGRDVWLGCTEADGSPEHLLAGLAAGLGVDADDADTEAVVRAVWRLAPAEVALVLDDLHRVPLDAPARRTVADLLDRLPGNGHLVVATRPPAEELVGRAELVLDESDLAFDDDELDDFATRRAVARAELEASGGWPALVELRAGVGHHVADDFLWEEVLAHLEPWRREALERLLRFGAFDDELVTAVTGLDISAAELVGDLPLTERAGDAVRLHDLWQQAAPRARAGDPGVRQGAALLQRRGRFREAFDVLLAEDDVEGLERLVARLAYAELPEVHTDDFAHVLGRAPARVLQTPHADLLRAQMLLGVDGAGAREALGDAASAFADAGDEDGECRALAQKLWMHAWESDVDAMGRILARLEELSAGGNERAKVTVDLSAAYLAQVSGDPESVIRIVEGGTVLAHPSTAGSGGFVLAVAHIERGEPEAALAAVEAARPFARGRLRVGLTGAAFEARLLLGLPDEATARAWMDELLELADAYGVAENQAQAKAGVAQVCTEYGWVQEARSLLAEAQRAGEVVGSRVGAALLIAEVSILLAEGDEEAAGALLREGLAADPHGAAGDRAWLRALSAAYALDPRSREVIDGMDLGPAWAFAASTGRALVAARGGDLGPAADFDWGDVARLRSAAPAAFVVELAVAAVAAGVDDARSAVHELSADAWPILRRLGEGEGGPLAEAARDVQTSVPRPPRSVVEIRVLGPLELLRGGEPVTERDWSRERVRAVLLSLVARRRAGRAALARSLWPDLEAGAASDNLRVNLNHLQRVLQPERGPHEASWFLRSEDDDLVLVPSSELEIDVDRFVADLDAGRAAEADAQPESAIGHYRSAVARYRGDYLLDADLADEGVEADRSRLRQGLAEAAVRAGELLLVQGDHGAAATLGARATEVDPFDESGHRLSARALRAGGDRAGAWRLLSSAVAMLRQEGLEPSAATLAELDELRGTG